MITADAKFNRGCPFPCWVIAAIISRAAAGTNGYDPVRDAAACHDDHEDAEKRNYEQQELQSSAAVVGGKTKHSFYETHTPSCSRVVRVCLPSAQRVGTSPSSVPLRHARMRVGGE